MKVKLVACTQPLIKTEDDSRFLSAEEFLVYAARVSNPSNQLNTLTSPKLLKYCIKHAHWSVFETASLTVEIVTSRAISAQIIRHRTFTFQEFSQRYSEVTDIESFDLRQQAESNRQSSTDLLPLTSEEIGMVKDHIVQSVELYEWLLKKGAARECARNVLPMSTQTTLYMTGSIRSWIHYISLRSKEGTQKEHRDIALAIKHLFCSIFPHTAEALEWIPSSAVRKNTLLSDNPQADKLPVANPQYIL